MGMRRWIARVVAATFLDRHCGGRNDSINNPPRMPVARFYGVVRFLVLTVGAMSFQRVSRLTSSAMSWASVVAGRRSSASMGVRLRSPYSSASRSTRS